MDTGISEELMIALLKLLKKYLMDDSVKIVDVTSQALRVSPLMLAHILYICRQGSRFNITVWLFQFSSCIFLNHLKTKGKLSF